MLPSMPILFSGSRDSCEDKTPASTDPKVSHDLNGVPSQKDEQGDVQMFGSFSMEDKDCDDELVLLAENSPFGERRKLQAQTGNPKKKRKIEAQSSEDSKNSDDLANHFATSYFMKAKGELDDSTFQNFIKLLSEINEESVNVVSLYNDIAELLKDHSELLEEFVGFLQPHHALEVGKLNEYFALEQTWNCFRKLDSFHFNRVNHLLEQLASNPDVNHETARTTLLSAFKGHPSIAESLIALLPEGKPSPNSKEDYEDITDMDFEDKPWENLNIGETSSKSCIPGECTCICHSYSSKKYCMYCDVKYLKGQIFVRTGKTLRFAKVTFEGSQQEEVLERLNPTYYKKKVPRKRTKSGSQGNKPRSDCPKVDGTQSENVQNNGEYRVSDDKERLTSDSEDHCLEKLVDEVLNDDDLLLESTNSDIEYDSGDDYRMSSPIVIDEPMDSPIKSASEEEIQADSKTELIIIKPEEEESKKEVAEIKNVPSEAENVKINEIKEECELNKDNLKPDDEILKIDLECEENKKDSEEAMEVNSEIEIKEEIEEGEIKESDNITSEVHAVSVSGATSTTNDSDLPQEPNGNPSTSKEDEPSLEDKRLKIWTREEDKLILQAFQRHIGSDQTFCEISGQLPSRSIDEIQGRFQVLMNLLEKVTSGCCDDFYHSK